MTRPGTTIAEEWSAFLAEAEYVELVHFHQVLTELARAGGLPHLGWPPSEMRTRLQALAGELVDALEEYAAFDREFRAYLTAERDKNAPTAPVINLRPEAANE